MLFLLTSVDNEYGTPSLAYYWQVCWTHLWDRADVQLANCMVLSGCHSVLALIVCILTMTGCGYPPLSVRAVAKKLSETLQIPALGLFDYNVSWFLPLKPSRPQSSLSQLIPTDRLSVSCHNYVCDYCLFSLSLTGCVYSWRTSLDLHGWEQRVMLMVLTHDCMILWCYFECV